MELKRKMLVFLSKRDKFEWEIAFDLRQVHTPLWTDPSQKLKTK